MAMCDVNTRIVFWRFLRRLMLTASEYSNGSHRSGSFRKPALPPGGIAFVIAVDCVGAVQALVRVPGGAGVHPGQRPLHHASGIRDRQMVQHQAAVETAPLWVQSCAYVIRW